jgi:predicted Kef-type K+ transport protein
LPQVLWRGRSKEYLLFEVICICFAFFFGLLVRRAGLPPLVGFLAAGFAINAFGPQLGLPPESGEVLDHISHLGVLLLLFTVGLKLRLGQIVQPQVLGSALAHVVIWSLGLGVVLALATGLDARTALVLAVALAFSSTVFSAKSIEAKRDIGTFYGRTTIGILVVQDLVALAVLAAAGGTVPSLWAIPALAALPFLRPVFFRLLDMSGRDELLVLAGMLLALVVGGAGFAALGISAEIGALAMGLMLSTHPRAKELSNALWGLKEVFLVGFFLQIGMSGIPGPEDMALAAVFLALLPLKGALFFFLLLLFRLRSRTAFLTALSLSVYSEFGLIVIAGLMPEWLVPMAVAVSLSLIIAAPFDFYAQRFYERFEPFLRRFEPARIHRDELPTDLGSARILILGMGRTGTAAYDHLVPVETRIVGLDADIYRLASLRESGRNVLFADVEDAGFWRDLRMGSLAAVILAMDSIEAKEQAAKALRRKGFAGPIVSHALYEDYLPRLRAAGATHTYLTMTQAGVGLAEQAAQAIDLDTSPPDKIPTS